MWSVQDQWTDGQNYFVPDKYRMLESRVFDESTLSATFRINGRDIVFQEDCIDCFRAMKQFEDVPKGFPQSMSDFQAYIDQKAKCQNKRKKTHQGNGVPKGAFAFTLTQSPKDELTKDDMIQAVRKIMYQKSCPVKKYAWYLEKADESHFHIHGMYETFTEGRIEKKHFKRAWPIWGEDKNKLGAGFRGGYHRPVRSEEAYSEYIRKDGGMSETNIPDLQIE